MGTNLQTVPELTGRTVKRLTHVALCLDNDEAGRNTAMAISALLPARYTTDLLLPAAFKDYNERLIQASC